MRAALKTVLEQHGAVIGQKNSTAAQPEILKKHLWT